MDTRAAVLERFGAPLTIRAVPSPQPTDGTVLVDVLAAPVLPYSAEVFSGARRYPLEPPVIPGAGGVGRAVAVGRDATRLREGDLVWCDSTVYARDDPVAPDVTLQGWSFRGEGGRLLSRRFHDGAFAERMSVPTENVVRLDGVQSHDAARWAAIGAYLVPYGGLRAVDMKPGEALLVSGSTGNFGSAAVAVGLAMGAEFVVCPGRNVAMLDDLRTRFGSRVRPVRLTGDADVDIEAMRGVANGSVDVVIDLLPPTAPSTAVRAATMTLRRGGRVILMGGVGMLGGDDLALPHPWLMRKSITVRGQWMYPRSVIPGLVALARAGLLDLGHDRVTTFPLTEANEAVAHAASNGGPFDRTVITPADRRPGGQP